MARWNTLAATPTLTILRAGGARSAGHRDAEDCEHDGRLRPPARGRTTSERRANLKHLVRHSALMEWCDLVNSAYRGLRQSAGVRLYLHDAVLANCQRDSPACLPTVPRDVAVGRRHRAHVDMAEQWLDALQRLRREVFDPGNVGADARCKLLIAAYLAVLERVFAQPDEGMPADAAARATASPAQSLQLTDVFCANCNAAQLAALT